MFIALACGGATSALGATFSATFSGLVYNRATNTYNSVLTLTNQGATQYAPLTVSISTGSPTVTVTGASGNGANTFNYAVPLPNGSLLPNESVKPVIAFADPGRIAFTPSVTSMNGAAAPQGLGVTVTSPTSGQTPLAPTFLVTGTFKAPGVAGVSLDGVPACIVGSSFYLNAFQPQTAPTSFTAAVTDIDGGQNSISIGIVPSSKGLQVTTSPGCGGSAPLTTTVNASLITTDGDTIESETIDFGAGGGPATESPGTAVQYVYTSPGLYTVTVTAMTALGAIVTQTALISVQTSAEAFAPILKNVSLLQSALGSGNAVRAASLFSLSSRPAYQAAFLTLGGQMPTAAGHLSPLTPVYLGTETAQASFNATVNGKSGLLTIELIRDAAGIWRVESW